MNAWFAERLHRLDNRINPILVKEIRQAFKAKFFVILFCIAVALTSVVAVYFAIQSQSDESNATTAGRELFTWLTGILVFGCVFFVPISHARRLRTEKEQRSFELLQTTTITPKKIVHGKIQSVLVEAFLYYSAISPFLILCYSFGGIDFDSMILVLAGLLWATWFSAIFSIALTSMTVAKRASQLAGLLHILILIPFCFMLIGYSLDLVRYRHPHIASWGWNGILITGFILILSYAVSRWLIAGAKNFFKPQGVNQSTEIKLWATLVFILWVSFGVGMSIYYSDPDPLRAFFFVIVPFLTINLLFLQHEADELSPRVFRDLVAGKYRYLPFKSLFLPGNIRAFAWYLLLMFSFPLIYAGLYDTLKPGSTAFNITTGRFFESLLVLIAHAMINVGIPVLFFNRGRIAKSIRSRRYNMTLVCVIWAAILQVTIIIISVFLVSRPGGYAMEKAIWNLNAFSCYGQMFSYHSDIENVSTLLILIAVPLLVHFLWRWVALIAPLRRELQKQKKADKAHV